MARINRQPAARMSVRERQKAKWGYIFLLPWFVMFCLFYAYPLLYGIVISFTDFEIGSMEWIGLSNYQQIFSDYAFWRSLWATFAYCLIVIPIEVLVPFWIANTLRPHGNKFNTVTKLLFYIPGIVCSVVLVIAWKVIISPGSGLLTDLLASFGVTGYSVFDQASSAIPVMSLMIALTCLGGNTIIYSAAMNEVPEVYYESAELDGATRWHQFRNITVPMLHSSILYVFVTSTIASLQIFVIPYLLTGGGPNYTTSTLLMMVYDKAFSGGQFGYASAIGIVLFLITALVAVVQFRVMRREVIEY